MISLIFLMMSGAWAAEPVIPSYDCKITIFAKDLLPAGYETTTVNRPFQSPGSHGGTPFEFTAGEHKVGIVADAKWRGIIWQRAGKDVAQVLTAGTAPITGNAVIILSNPADLDEAVHLVCDPVAGDFPKE